MLKFLQTLSFRFSICLSAFFPGKLLETNVQKILKSGSRSSSACNALNFFSRILKSEALVFFFLIYI